MRENIQEHLRVESVLHPKRNTSKQQSKQQPPRGHRKEAESGVGRCGALPRATWVSQVGRMRTGRCSKGIIHEDLAD